LFGVISKQLKQGKTILFFIYNFLFRRH